MSLFGVFNTTTCRWCGDEFANHYYVPGSIDQYKCPHPYVGMGYGFFNGGDPRKFHPDVECCFPEQLEQHRLACDEAEKLAHHRNLPCPSGFERREDGEVHVLRSAFGLGVYEIERETFFEPVESDDEDESEGPF